MNPFKKANWTKWLYVGTSTYACDPHLVFARRNNDTGLWEYRRVDCNGLSNGAPIVGNFIKDYEQTEETK